MWTWIRVGGGQVGSKWSIRCFRKPTVFADCEAFQKGAKLKLRHYKRSETLGVTLVHTQQCYGQTLEDDLKGPEGTALHVRDRGRCEANMTQKMTPAT